MKNHSVSIFISIILFIGFYSPLSAQWQSLGNDIIPKDHRIWSIKVAPDQSIWALSTFDSFPPSDHLPILHRSTDEGLSWSQQAIAGADSRFGWDISPLDSLHAFAALGNGGLYETKDGGVTWEVVRSFPLYSQAVHFFNEEEGVVIGLDSFNYLVIGFTVNGGKVWRPLGGAFQHQGINSSLPVRNPTERLPAITFSVNAAYDYYENSMMIGTSLGGYWISRDKGHNWTRNTTPLVGLGIAVSNVAMEDEKTFLVSGDIRTSDRTGTETLSFVTRDGGQSWVQGSPGITAAAAHSIPGREGTFILVGHNDFGWGSAGTAISYDYGANWQIIDDRSLIAIDFSAEGLGVGACCNNHWSTANGQIMMWDFDFILATEDQQFSHKMTLRPNPVQDQLLIDIGEEFAGKALNLLITAANGQVMRQIQEPYAASLRVDVSSLPKGLYTIRLSSLERWAIEKFMKL